MSIGDINSTEKGSGARFNDGKPDYSLIPLKVIARQWADKPELDDLGVVMLALGEYQATQVDSHLYAAIHHLGEPWDDCARVFSYGAKKYASWNYAKGMNWSVPIACAARHLMAMRRGELIDPESGLSHRGHIMCNIVMLLLYAENYLEGNDLPAKGVLP